MSAFSFSLFLLFYSFLTFLSVGQGRIRYSTSCRSPRKGNCVNVYNCHHYSKLLALPRPNPQLIKDIKTNLCGFVNQDTPKVCCPALPQVIEHPNAKLLPREKCGPLLPSSRIMEGGYASPREFPWMALLAYKTGDSPSDEEFKCGGTLINNRYILTAAHCLVDNAVLGVRLGEYDIRTEIDCDKTGRMCEPPVQDLLISKITIHEGYNPITFINDIALLRLATPANLTYDNVKPICLPITGFSNTNLVGRFLTVTGWGVTETGHKSMVLSKVSIPVVPLKECYRLYSKYKPITKNQICAGGYRGRDSCSGDSGGPLQYFDSSRNCYVQEGIVSYGPSQCGIDGKPAVYTNVKEYLTWILDNIEP